MRTKTFQKHFSYSDSVANEVSLEFKKNILTYFLSQIIYDYISVM